MNFGVFDTPLGHPRSPFWKPGVTFGANEKEVEKKKATGSEKLHPRRPKSGLRGAGGERYERG